MPRKPQPKAPTAYIVELISHPMPLGLIARELLRNIELLKCLCFKDNEYGAEAGVKAILDQRLVQPLNKRFKRCGKPARIISIEASPRQHHRMIVTYEGPEGDCEQLFTLFEPSRRMRAAERDQSSDRSLSGPRRGAKVPAKKKKKKKAKNG